MDQLGEWIFRGVAGAIAACLVGACVKLFGRVREAENKQGRFAERIDDLEGRDTGAGEVAKLRRELAEFKLCVERNFVRRDDWVPHTSRVLGALESQGRLLARLDERLKQEDRHG